MSAVGPWDTPVDDGQTSSHRWLAVLGSWGMAGASAGSAVGGVMQAVQGVEGASSAFGTAGIAVGAGLGALALIAERKASEARPVLMDARGQPSRPLHGALFAVPVGVALPSLLVLGLVASLSLGSLVPLAAFGATAFAVAWAGLRVWSTHRFTTALEAVEEGDHALAHDRLASLADSWVASRSARGAARLNLGMIALQDGRGADALAWIEGMSGTPPAWAHAGRALALLLQQRPEEAEAALGAGLASDGARLVQEQLDAVRVLLIWRTEGPEAARLLGERLGGPAATPLHRAMLAALRPEPGSLDDEVQALVASGLGRALPELAGLGRPTG